MAKLLANSVLFPAKILIKLAFKLLLGLVLILVVNLFFQLIGLTIPLNIYTIFSAGILGIPGIILIIFLKYI